MLYGVALTRSVSGPLEAASLRDQARRAIWAEIVTGELRPGQVYPVATFTSRLGVSATPIREALLELANTGLVEVVRNRGFRVPVLTEHDLDEIFELRILLEVPSMRQLAGKLPPKDVHEFRRLARQIEGRAAAADALGFLEADRVFHLGLLERIGNQRLVETAGRLRDESRRYGLNDLAAKGVLMESAREHVRLLDAIERNNPSEAEARMRYHLQHARGLWAGEIPGT